MNKILPVFLLFLALALRADDIILANGQTISGTVSRIDVDGIVFQTARGGVKYQWRNLNAESAKALQAKGELSRKQDALQAEFVRKMESGETKIFSPKEIQTSAFSLKDEIVLMDASGQKQQEIEAGKYRIRWGYQVEAVLPAELADIALKSEMLFVRVTEPSKYTSKLEVLGNTLARSSTGIAPGWK